jgi:cellulose biosynthesis protein BcsQ
LLDRLLIADIDLDPQGGARRTFDFSDRGIRRHILGLGLEFLWGRTFGSTTVIMAFEPANLLK